MPVSDVMITIIDFVFCFSILCLQMIYDCVIPFANKYALAFGQIQKDLNRKDLQTLYKLDLVALMQVSKAIRLLHIRCEKINVISIDRLSD